ncbi:MAG: hypothetical protein COA82_11540 [Alkaliphilus sp.]|nr:hypothetical protein [bacterium AH-315-E09]PHS30318.1 MAG: hypothetical protein COA82_11540 [Alkaliphilus sp.]
MINVQYSKTAFKKIKQFDKSTRTRIIDAVSKLPYGDVKRLKNDTNSAIYGFFQESKSRTVHACL